jgi:hypothetical protein
VLNILVIAAVLKELSTYHQLTLVCGNAEDEKASSFDASTTIARIFKYSKIQLSSQFFALFGKITRLISI